MANGYDVMICGGGLTGLGLAAALAGCGLRVALADPALDAPDGATLDGRVTALTRASQSLLAGWGAWEAIAPHAEPILRVMATDARAGRAPSPLRLTLDGDELGDGPLGFIAENRTLRAALLAAAKKSGTALIAERVDEMSAGPRAAGLRLSSGKSVSAALAVAADGRGSPLRAMSGLKTVRRDYDQIAIVVTISHEHPHLGVACDHFLPAGPFAVLPMTGNRSSLVWSERPGDAARILALPDDAFDGEIQARVGARLGAVHAEGNRWSYPLRLMLARGFVAPRLALIGDAAHAMHPLAGQNFNFSLQDVAALSATLREGVAAGLDPGDASLLLRYQRRRRPADVAGAFAMDAVDRIFSNDIAPLRFARDLGLSAIQAIGPLRRLFLRVGDE